MIDTTTPYYEKEKVRKRHQISFRRWMKGLSPSIEIANYVTLSMPEIRKWISSQWLDGMEWSNYGPLWVVDHLVPIRLFDYNKVQDMLLCWNYRNLMPLLRVDNLHKEGDLHFSLYKLRAMEKCHITSELIRIVEVEIESMQKYLVKTATFV